MQNIWFKDWFNSPYYHQLYINRDNNEAATFIDKLISYLQPPENSTILDVACGKGRHSIQLASKGFDITGIDLSKESIDIALLNQSKNLHFFLHDMRQPCWINYFNYAFNFFTSFGYFKSQLENNKAINSIANSIKKEGYFIMDYLNAPFIENNLKSNTLKKNGDIEFEILKWVDDKYIYKKIKITDKNLTAPIIFTEQVEKFSLPIFTKLFAKNNLQIIETFGNYNLDIYNEQTSPRLIMIAKKI